MQYTIIGFTKSPCKDNNLQFMFLLVCSSETHDWKVNGCVCAVDHYQTTAANETTAPVCTACPPGSTTKGSTNSSACCKYNIIIILIPWCSMLSHRLWY